VHLVQAGADPEELLAVFGNSPIRPNLHDPDLLQVGLARRETVAHGRLGSLTGREPTRAVSSTGVGGNQLADRLADFI
jgi:hypothetical protein